MWNARKALATDTLRQHLTTVRAAAALAAAEIARETAPFEATEARYRAVKDQIAVEERQLTETVRRQHESGEKLIAAQPPGTPVADARAELVEAQRPSSGTSSPPPSENMSSTRVCPSASAAGTPGG